MTLKIRRILFYSLTALFFAAGAAIIFYSNGWRFDLTTLTIAKLGGIYFENIPTEVKVNIEKTKLSFSPGLLNSSLLIANLFPKTHAVAISKDNYQPWRKEIPVKPSLVTEIPPIILLPEKIILSSTTKKEYAEFLARDKKSLAEKPAESYLSPDGKKTASLKENNDLMIKWPENPEKDAAFNLGNIEKIAWHRNSSYLFIKYPDSLYLLETSKFPPINFQLVDSSARKFQYLPEKNLVYLLKGSSLYSFELK